MGVGNRVAKAWALATSVAVGSHGALFDNGDSSSGLVPNVSGQVFDRT
ncbi:unannotated protein [freshwater metagenome]|uniref:Unannotated protein n=1 Tax=freshwater metagenome TaxID=449393 RepID=A0A6J6XFI1_9ZZZZ